MMFLHYCMTLMPQLLKGLLITLELFAMTIVLALPLGLLVSLGRITKFKPIKWLMGLYVWVMRGTPLLLQLFFVYYGLPFVSKYLQFDSYQAALIALTFNYAA
jgi:polar amino acid transport system permease protein